VIVPMFNPAEVMRAIAERRVTDALLVPTMIQMLVDDPAVSDSDLSSLLHLVYVRPRSPKRCWSGPERFSRQPDSPRHTG
jgi:acyl-CoA synthetase (AMP-forming)/AMP-acid ligase II